MSMVINLVEDHNIYLCEGGPVYNGGVQPTPITYLTQWKVVGNSEVHGTEIWSCGEYSAVDGKWHILVQPLGGSVTDIALTEPLRKVNDVADTIEFPSNTEGKALVTRAFGRVDLGRDMSWNFSSSSNRMYSGTNIGCKYVSATLVANILCSVYNTISNNDTLNGIVGIATQSAGTGAISVYDDNYNTSESKNDFVAHLQGVELVFELDTPITELVDVPQIAEAESYSCVISQGAKAVEWSSFITE